MVEYRYWQGGGWRHVCLLQFLLFVMVVVQVVDHQIRIQGNTYQDKA